MSSTDTPRFEPDDKLAVTERTLADLAAIMQKEWSENEKLFPVEWAEKHFAEREALILARVVVLCRMLREEREKNRTDGTQETTDTAPMPKDTP